MRVRAVVLDVDGTVATCPYDFEAMREAVGRAARRWGVDAAALGVRGIIEQIAAVASRLGADGDRFRKEAEAAVVALEIEGARRSRLLPGAAEAIGRLRRRGIAVGLITRNCRMASEIVLRDLREYDSLLARDDVPLPKPNPDHVHRSLAALGVEAAAAVMVGDHSYDMEAGRAAGVRACVGVSTGGSQDQALLEAGADVVLASVMQLPEWLSGLEGRRG